MHKFSFSSVPWDLNTRYGYICEVILDISGTETYYIANGSLLLFFISMCLHHRAFLKMFEHFLMNLNKQDDQYKKGNLSKLIKYHNLIKGWVKMILTS